MTKSILLNDTKAPALDLSSSENSLQRHHKPSLYQRLHAGHERYENDVILNTTYSPKQGAPAPGSVAGVSSADEVFVRSMNAAAESASGQDAKASRLRRRKKSLFEALGEEDSETVEQIQREIGENLDNDTGLSLAREVLDRQLEKEDLLGIKETHARDAALGAFRGTVSDYDLHCKKVENDTAEPIKDEEEP